MIREAEKIGLRTASEVFADRTYQADGSLTRRTAPRALISDAQRGVAQIRQMIESGTVTAIGGAPVSVKAETVCIHGDAAHALEFAGAMRDALAADGVRICPPGGKIK